MNKPAKYMLTPEANNVHGRFARLYETGAAGKGSLVTQCVAGGMMLKECGILETINMLDQHPAYQAGTPSVRRALLINELIALLGNQAPVHQPTSDVLTAQLVAPVVAPSPAPQTPAASDTAAKDPQKPDLPRLGV